MRKLLLLACLNAGAQASPAGVPAMIDHLAKNFPPKSLPVLPSP